jgi:hypothetical protein
MATLKEQITVVSTTIVISLASLASGSWRQSAFVENTSNLLMDAFVQSIVKTAGTAAGTVDLWLYGSNDGTTYSDGATGLDAAFTPTATPNLVFLGSVNTPAVTTSYTSRLFSVAAAFGGSIPKQWGIAAKNTNGGALDSTAGNFSMTYLGLTYQSV